MINYYYPPQLVVSRTYYVVPLNDNSEGELLAANASRVGGHIQLLSDIDLFINDGTIDGGDGTAELNKGKLITGKGAIHYLKHEGKVVRGGIRGIHNKGTTISILICEEVLA